MAYCTPAEFQRWHGITTLSGDDLLDAERVLDAAAGQLEGHCGRTFTAATAGPGGFTVRAFDVRAGDRILFVDDYVELGAVTDDEGSTVDPDDVEPITVGNGRPYSMIRSYVPRRGTWTVSARWGWPAVPDAVIQANLMLAAKLWQRRLSPSGIQGSADAGFIRVHGIDRDIEALLAPYVVLRGGFG